MKSALDLLYELRDSELRYPKNPNDYAVSVEFESSSSASHHGVEFNGLALRKILYN